MSKDEIVDSIKKKLHGNPGTSVKYLIPDSKLRNEVIIDLSKFGFKIHHDPVDNNMIWIRFRG